MSSDSVDCGGETCPVIVSNSRHIYLAPHSPHHHSTRLNQPPQSTLSLNMSQSAHHSSHHHWICLNQPPPSAKTITGHVSISPPQSTPSLDMSQTAPPQSTRSLDTSQSAPYSPHYHWTSLSQLPHGPHYHSTCLNQAPPQSTLSLGMSQSAPPQSTLSLDMSQSTLQSTLLTPSLILSMSTLPNTLLGTDVKVIPLQFPHSVRSPFFSILTISPCFHVFGTFSCSLIILNNFASHFSVVRMSAFNNSAIISSLPPAFPFFIFLSAVLTSAIVIGSVLISFVIGSISTSVTGSSRIGLLRISSVFFPLLPSGQFFC